MTRLVFHIGHTKTGTTALQRAFADSRTSLAARGILYPRPPHSVNHRALKGFFLNESETDKRGRIRKGGAARAAAARKWEAIVAEVAAALPDTVVLSAEGFFRPLTDAQMDRMVAELARIADTVEIVAYLRSPAPFFLSATQQHLKHRPNIRIPSATRYRDALEPYLRRGPGRVIARAFERDRLVGQDILADFCATVLPDLTPADFDTSGVEANVSVSAEAMALLHELNSGRRPPPGWARALPVWSVGSLIRKADRRLPGATKPRLWPEIVAAVEAHAADLDWLAETFGIVFSDVAPPSMERADADARLSRIAGIEDMCPVDPARKEALWAAVAAEAFARTNPFRRLAAALRRA